MPPDAPGKILVPRWVQLVGLPLAIVGVWLLVSAVNHAVFVFVVAALIAILLNPIVRAFCALRIPRAASVLLVYLFFAFVVGGLSVIAGTVIAREVQDVANQVEDQFTENSAGVTPADKRLADLQRWIDESSPVKVDVKAPGERLLNSGNTSNRCTIQARPSACGRTLISMPSARFWAAGTSLLAPSATIARRAPSKSRIDGSTNGLLFSRTLCSRATSKSTR